jgi:hypothetical protein
VEEFPDDRTAEAETRRKQQTDRHNKMLYCREAAFVNFNSPVFTPALYVARAVRLAAELVAPLFVERQPRDGSVSQGP